MPRLWQRGIALYFVGKHELAAEQFVQHREVNPHDVENAAWHFLCVAKAESFDKARQSVLPAPNDPRIPMTEVQQMLRSGDTDRVTRRMDKVPAESPDRNSAMFYGNFYLGLYADARGDQQTALTKMSLAAKDAPHHYMGDIARVYATYLQRLSSKNSE
jgi:lipoprotein NlpI